MPDTTPYISILGDSLSTFHGASPWDGVFYDRAFAAAAGLGSVEDTWWQKVVRRLGGTLLKNDSYAGSTVTAFGYQPGCSPRRLRRLARDKQVPDLILIFLGMNDVACLVSQDRFAAGYGEMLRLLREFYPRAAVWCGTLLRGFVTDPHRPLFADLDACLPLRDYNNAILEQCRQHGCHPADLALFGQRYSSLDGIHPDADGMSLLADLWLQCLK